MRSQIRTPVDTHRHLPWIAGLVLGLLMWFFFGKSAGPSLQIERTQQIFSISCAYCHGADARGDKSAAKAMGLQPQVLDLGKRTTQEKPDRQLEYIIEIGSGPMPPFQEKLTAEEIHELVRFLRNLTPVKAIMDR